MPDYKRMYLTLVDEIANTMDNLKVALQKAENIYIDTSEAADEADAADIKTKASQVSTKVIKKYLRIQALQPEWQVLHVHQKTLRVREAFVFCEATESYIIITRKGFQASAAVSS